MRLVTVPSAVHNDYFKWQLDLLWYGHKKAYGEQAKEKLFACVAKRNWPNEPVNETCQWETDAPVHMVDVFFDHFKNDKRVDGWNGLHQPLNIPLAVKAATENLPDDVLLEVLDCDLVHFRPHQDIEIDHDEMLVCDIYEKWHLESKGKYKSVMDIYTGGDANYYNGGFVPLIASVKTFKKILPDWISILHHFNTLKYTTNVLWWGGMYAMNAACERNKVKMTGKNLCYIPHVNEFSEEQHIAHYCCDHLFNKRQFPNIDQSTFKDNQFYKLVSEWIGQRKE